MSDVMGAIEYICQLQKERYDLAERVKTLEDAVAHQIRFGFKADCLTRLQQALAAKEPTA